MSTKYKGVTPVQVSEFMSKLADAANLSSLSPEALLAIKQDMRRFGAHFQWLVENYQSIDIGMTSAVFGSTVRSLTQAFDQSYQKNYLDRKVEEGRLIFREGAQIKPTADKSRFFFKLLLMAPNTAEQNVSREFALRNFESASAFEVVRLLDSLCNSKKSNYPFVSMSDSVVVYYLDGNKDGPIVVRPINSRQTWPNLYWSYVGVRS